MWLTLVVRLVSVLTITSIHRQWDLLKMDQVAGVGLIIGGEFTINQLTGLSLFYLIRDFVRDDDFGSHVDFLS